VNAAPLGSRSLGYSTRRTVLVTGVSRRSGIGFAVARRLLARGDRLVVASWAPHDEQQPWGADDMPTLLSALGDPPHLAVDLADPRAPADLVARAADVVGPLSTLVAAHARSAGGDLTTVTAAELDACFAVNARASVLLTQAFAGQYEPDAGPGRVVLFTSGQHRGPMPGEIAYALSKGAIQQITATLAAELAPRGIAVTCLNPGPTDTGWADAATRVRVAEGFPSGRWTTPDEIAGVVEWLAGPSGALFGGATLDAEAGFRR
jgi:3-oxoacyl-[acyl-carrier protein] reductase